MNNNVMLSRNGGVNKIRYGDIKYVREETCENLSHSHYSFQCSRCGKEHYEPIYYDWDIEFKYCPGCGAKVVGIGDSNGKL